MWSSGRKQGRQGSEVTRMLLKNITHHLSVNNRAKVKGLHGNLTTSVDLKNELAT